MNAHLKLFYTKALALALLLPGLSSAAEADPQLKVLGLSRDKAVLEIDGRSRVLRVGEASPEGVRLISSSAREAVVEVGGQTKTLRLSRHVGVGGGFSTPERTEVQVLPNAQGAYVTQGRINGHDLPMVVDTGASVVAMSERQAKALAIEYQNAQPAGVETASGVQEARLVRLNRVEVGGIALTGVEAVVVSGDYPGITLLGMSFLRRVDLEHQGGMLILRSRP